MQKKKAISLIVLVITIIVMIILASAIIMSLDNTNIFNKAEEATDKYTHVQEKQKMQIAVLNAAEMGGVNETNLTKTINDEFDEDWEYFSKLEDCCVVRIISSQRRYEITTQGKLEDYEETELADKNLFTYNGTTITGLSAYGKETLTALAGKNVKLVIPEEFTAISEANSWNITAVNNLKSLSIDAQNITSVGQDVFFNCKSLVSVYTPNITIIGQDAFRACKALVSIYAPKITKTSHQNFMDCTNLTNVDISSATSIAQGTFGNCTSLSNINLPNVTTIEEGAFWGCSNLTFIDLPNVITIGYNAFYVCRQLREVNIPNAHTIVGNAFWGCTNLVNVNAENLESIGSRAFYGCINLNSIDLSKATTIGGMAFTNCENLSSVDLSSMVNIVDQAFYFCKGLRNIKFSSKLESVGYLSVYGYSNKLTVEYTGTIEEWNNISINATNDLLKKAKAKIICSDGIINE